MSKAQRTKALWARAAAWVQVCALALVTLASPVGCKPSAPPSGGAATLPTSGAEASAVLASVARYLPASTFFVINVDLSQLGQGYSAFFTEALGMTRAEYAAMLKELRDFALERLGWIASDVQWALLGVGERKEMVALIRADAQIQRGLEPIPGTDGLKGLQFEGITIIPLPEQGLYALLMDRDSLTWFSNRKETLDSAEGKARLDTLSGLLRRGNTKSLIAAAVTLDADAKPIQKLRRDLPPPLQKLRGASITLGDALAFNVLADNQDLKAINELLGALVTQGQAALRAERADLDRKDTAEGAFIIAASHLLQPAARTLTPKIEGDYAMIRFGSQGDPAMNALIGVWIVGVLAAVAVRMFQSYTQDAKATEGKLNLKAIGDGALVYANQARFDPATGQVSEGVFPTTQGIVCTSTGGSLNTADNPNSREFSERPWRDLYFAISRPHYFRYCYESSDGQRFRATATAGSLTLEITGVMRAGSPVLSAIKEVY